jgi:transposase-like protein
MRNVSTHHIPKGSKSVGVAALGTIYAQPDGEAGGQQLEEIAKTMWSQRPKAAVQVRSNLAQVLERRQS